MEDNKPLYTSNRKKEIKIVANGNNMTKEELLKEHEYHERRGDFLKELHKETNCSIIEAFDAFEHFGFHYDACKEWLCIKNISINWKEGSENIVDRVQLVKDKFNITEVVKKATRRNNNMLQRDEITRKVIAELTAITGVVDLTEDDDIIDMMDDTGMDFEDIVLPVIEKIANEYNIYPYNSLPDTDTIGEVVDYIYQNIVEE